MTLIEYRSGLISLLSLMRAARFTGPYSDAVGAISHRRAIPPNSTEEQTKPSGPGDGNRGDEEQTEDADQAEHKAEGLALLVHVGSRHGSDVNRASRSALPNGSHRLESSGQHERALGTTSGQAHFPE